MQSQSSRRRSGPAAATASEGASGQARRRKGTERSFSVRIMKATAQRSVCVCEQGGGPTGLGLSILGGIRGSMRQCASSPLVARTRRRRQLARMGQMFCQLCAAKKDIDCAAAAAAAAAIHSRMEWPKRRRRRIRRMGRRRRRREKNEERNVSCDQATAFIKSRRQRQGRLRQHFAPLSELRRYGHPRHRRPSEDESISRMNRH